jgi:hypothetical protein
MLFDSEFSGTTGRSTRGVSMEQKDGNENRRKRISAPLALNAL